LSAHCHDDLGLAVANSLAAVRGGARQVEATICGIGERAGNAALEEVVMAIKTRRTDFDLELGVDAAWLHPTARLLEALTGQSIPRNKAVVGGNAFSHEAGIHQHGVLAHRETYEILRPEDVGQVSSLVLGKHSGRHALRRRIEELGHALDDDALDGVFAAFKLLADRKQEILDEDLEALVIGTSLHQRGPWALEHLQTTAGTNAMASAAVRVRHENGEEITEAAVGDGPVDASFRALVRATDCPALLREFQVKSVSVGEDAQGLVTVQCSFDGRQVRGQGISTDIVEASSLAILDAINRAAREGRPSAPTEAAIQS
jgi:2-isopropylmalate synthase